MSLLKLLKGLITIKHKNRLFLSEDFLLKKHYDNVNFSLNRIATSMIKSPIMCVYCIKSLETSFPYITIINVKINMLSFSHDPKSLNKLFQQVLKLYISVGMNIVLS